MFQENYRMVCAIYRQRVKEAKNALDIKNICEKCILRIMDIINQGTGIPADELPHMFGRLFRASIAAGITGTWIGLSVSKAFVQMHGGTISMVSSQGEGSTFTERLPVNRKSLL